MKNIERGKGMGTLKKKSPYRMGWMMAMFDLPVVLQEERKEAARFRKALLDDGFIMIQYSVYARPCVSLEKMMSYHDKVKTYAPTTGDVRLLFFTDKQWSTSKLINMRGKKLEKVPEQIEFWGSDFYEQEMGEKSRQKTIEGPKKEKNKPPPKSAHTDEKNGFFLI